MNMFSSLASNPKERRLAWPTLVLALCLGCSSGLDNQSSYLATPQKAKRGPNQSRFRNPEMDAKYKAAKASPRSFEPVYAYAKAVTDTCLASLVDTSCKGCAEGVVRYKRRTEIEPHFWPIIDEALSMLEDLGKLPRLDMEQMDQLVATRGRLLWLAGRSVEEQNLIDDYALAHPNAVAVIRRRLELLRESGDATAIESQCARSRKKTESAPEVARADLLAACVAFHPGNKNGRSDLLDYAKYLPNMSPAEDAVYRNSLVQRCVEAVGDEEARCADACACEDKDAGKQPTPKCKQACNSCRNETAQKLRVCKKVGEPPPAPAPSPSAAAKPKLAPAVSLPPPKVGPVKEAPRPKKVDDGKGLKPVEL
jgi:hypothetical protein